jgi:hypothetical protein
VAIRIGCPHEEGKDYPLGENCPQCPYWANRDRWSGKLIGKQRKRAPEVPIVTGCAWYRPEQWERLREISTDRDKLADTYEEWLETAERSLREMRTAGIYAEKVEIDVEALLAWCRAQGKEVNGEARAQYAAHLGQQRRQTRDREGEG